MEHQIKFGSRTIVFDLEYLKRKSLSIKVHPDNRIEVLAPVGAMENKVMEKLKAKAPWILKQVDHFNSFKPSTPQRRYISGETHLYLGRQYRLKIAKGKEETIKAYRGQLWVYSFNPEPGHLKIQLEQWYNQRAKTIFDELLEDVVPKFKRYKITKPALVVRTMAKRWGSCTTAGKIILNTELIKAPKACIEYVIIHELCHLVHYNHSREFQHLLNKMLPDWRKWKDRLEYGLA